MKERAGQPSSWLGLNKSSLDPPCLLGFTLSLQAWLMFLQRTMISGNQAKLAWAWALVYRFLDVHVI